MESDLNKFDEVLQALNSANGHPMKSDTVGEPIPYYGNIFNNKMHLSTLVQAGLSEDLFRTIMSHTPFNENQWATFLNVSVRTLQRSRQSPSSVFKPIHTEKIIEIAELTYQGLIVFDSLEKFNRWLNTPSLLFDGRLPLELVQNSFGQELLKAELNRIDHGIFA